MFFGLYRLGGFPLLTLVFSGSITLAFAFVYLCSPGRPYHAGFALLLGALATAPTWGVRPQMVSLLLMSLFVFLLLRYTRRPAMKLLVPLPLLIALWVNLHSGYALGLVVIAAFLAAAAFERIRSRASLRPVLPLVVTLGLAFAAVLLNPNGARMFAYPFETLTSPTMQRYIQEWFSPDFHQIEWLPFALLLAATLGAALVARAPVPLALALLVFLFGLAALRSARNVPLFVVAAVPVLSAQLAALVPLRASTASTRRLMGLVNISLALVIAAAALVRIQGVLANQAASERANYPASAVEWIQANRPPPNIYNTYAWGGYLIWKLHPEYPVFIDGRADVHGDLFIEQFLDTYRAAPGWQAELDQRDVRIVLVEPDAPLAAALADSADWRAVLSDSRSVLYVRE
jgi:hypothetical protein